MDTEKKQHFVAQYSNCVGETNAVIITPNRQLRLENNVINLVDRYRYYC